MATVDSKPGELTGTKLALVQAGGDLFARKGLRGTSTRAIAREADSNIGCIHYHFGGKEGLFWATVEYVLHCRITSQNESLELPARPTRQNVSNALAELVRRRVLAGCGPAVPAWHSRLLWRSVADGLLVDRHELVDRVFRPDFDRFRDLVRRARSGISDQQTRLLFYQLIAQLIFYSQHRPKVCRELGVETYNESHLAAIGDHIALSLTRVLQLPDPAGRGE